MAKIRGGQIVIRSARLKDLNAVLELWKRADAAPSMTDEITALQVRLRRDRQLFLLAWHGQRLVGSLIGGWDGWRASMARLTVDPMYRRQRIARRLVAQVERRLRKRGARRISALVFRDNRRAQSFWRAAGYEHESRVQRFVRDLF